MVNHRQTKDTAMANNKKTKIICMCLKAPFTLLAVVRDLYVRSITNCSGRGGYGSTPRFNGLQKSPSLSSSRLSTTKSYNEDFSELVRAASTRTLVESNIERFIINGRKSPAKFVIGIETIDEEKPCEFGDIEVRVSARVRRLRYV